MTEPTRPTPWRELGQTEKHPCDAADCPQDAAFVNTVSGKRYCLVDAYRRKDER